MSRASSVGPISTSTDPCLTENGRSDFASTVLFTERGINNGCTAQHNIYINISDLFSVLLSLSLSIYLSIYLSVFISLSLYIYIYMHVYRYICIYTKTVQVRRIWLNVNIYVEFNRFLFKVFLLLDRLPYQLKSPVSIHTKREIT